MDSTQFVLGATFATIISLASLACMIYISIKIYHENGIWYALFGFFCCQIYPLLWGFMNASRLKMWDVIAFWVFLILLSIFVQWVFLQSGYEELSLQLMNQ